MQIFFALYSHHNHYTAVYNVEDTIARLTQKLKNYNIKINPAKSDGLIFSYHSTYKKPTHFYINNQGWPFSNHLTYLDITLDSHLTYSKHLTKKLSNMRHKIKSLYKLLCSPNITICLKLLIFKTIIRPSLLYGALLFRELYTSMLIKLQQFEGWIFVLFKFPLKLCVQVVN